MVDLIGYARRCSDQSLSVRDESVNTHGFHAHIWSPRLRSNCEMSWKTYEFLRLKFLIKNFRIVWHWCWHKKNLLIVNNGLFLLLISMCAE